MHLDTVFVNEGDSVKQGDPVGLLGNTGAARAIGSGGPHLHLERRRRIGTGVGSTINPEPFLKTKFDINGKKIK